MSHRPQVVHTPYLTSLPRRRNVAKFHFNDQDSSPSDDDDDLPHPRLKLTITPPSASPRPKPSRTSSTPILLSNGKPLKSSLKSSSSPNLQLITGHLRSASAPSSPNSDLLSTVPSTTSTPKNVHFPSDLVDIRLFNASAKPLSVSSPRFDDTETETEGEPVTGYPFPTISVHKRHGSQSWRYDFSSHTSSVPNPRLDPSANVFLDSIRLSPSAHVSVASHGHYGADRSATLPHNADEIYLTGTVRLKNIFFEKMVHIRFTLDNWSTTSEVVGRYLKSLPPIHPAEPSFDVFSFALSLPIPTLVSKTLWMVVRYTVPGIGEWWDNNSGSNYRVEFQRTHASSTTPSSGTSSSSAFGPLQVPRRPSRMERSLSEGDTRALPQSLYGYSPGQNAVFTSGSSNGFGYTPSSVSFSSYSPSPFSGTSTAGSFATGAPPNSIGTTHGPKEREEQHEALQNATEKRLRGFSLSNYARPTVPAPVPKMPIPSTTAPAPSVEKNPVVQPSGTMNISAQGENSVVFPRSASLSSDEESESTPVLAPTTAAAKGPKPNTGLSSTLNSDSQDSTESKRPGARSPENRITIKTDNLPISGLISEPRHKHHEPHNANSPLLAPLSPTEPSDLVRSIGALDIHSHHHQNGEDEKEMAVGLAFIPSRESSTSSMDGSFSLGDSASLDDIAPWIRLPSSGSGSSLSEMDAPVNLPALDRSRSSSTSTSEESEFEGLFTVSSVLRRRAHPNSMTGRPGRHGAAGSVRPPTPPPSLKRMVSDEIKEPAPGGASAAQQALSAFGVRPSSPPKFTGGSQAAPSTTHSKAPTTAPTKSTLSPPTLAPPQPHAGTVGPGMDSDSLYNAFVRKWCFATTPPVAGTPGAMVP